VSGRKEGERMENRTEERKIEGELIIIKIIKKTEGEG